MMKYFKISFSVFFFALLLAVTNVNAEVHGFFGVTVKRFSAPYTSNAYTKVDTGTQFLFETKCTDDLTDDDRTVQSRLYRVVTPIYTSWITAVKQDYVYYNSTSQTVTDWKFILKSKKSLITTATFYGHVGY